MITWRLGRPVLGGLSWIFVAAATTPVRAQDVPLVLEGGSYLDVVTGRLHPNSGIVMLGGRLLSVGSMEVDVDLSDAQTLSLDGDQYVLPGLFDLHAHYNVQLLGQPRMEELHATPVLFLANGVTSTFPAGEYDPVGMWELRKRVDRGEQPGPRIYNSGPYYGSARPGWRKMSKGELWAEVDLWVERGVKGFKAKRPDPETLRWLIERAHFHGVTVTGHLDSGYRNSVNPRDAILMGIDRVEHFLGGDAFTDDRTAYASFPGFRANSPEFHDIVELFKKHDVTYDATVTAYGYFGKRAREGDIFAYWTDEQRFLTPEVRRWMDESPPDRLLAQFDSIFAVKCPLVKAFHDAGGTIGLATDHPSWGEYLPGFVAHRELHALAECGIDEADVLRIGTLNGARALGVSDRLGSLEAGKLADLFVVRGNPLEDIRNTRNVEWVIRSGHLYSAPDLLKSIEGTLGPRRPAGP